MEKTERGLPARISGGSPIEDVHSPSIRRHSARRGLASGVTLIALLLSLATGGQAAVRFDMFVGFDGLVPVGNWFPISFEVQNDGPPFTATVEVSAGQFNTAHDRTMVVELPTGTTKRFVMPTFNSGSYNPTWSARLLDEQRRVRAETTSQRVRRVQDSGTALAASISRVAPALPEFKLRQEDSRPVIGRLQPAVFPDNPIALAGLDTLYLGSERALDLKAAQVGTLLAWLHGGGHLIVGLEQLNHLSGPGSWLKPVLPIEPAGIGASSGHAALQQWVSSSKRFDGSNFPPPPSNARSTSGNSGYTALTNDPAFAATPLQVVTGRLRDGRVLAGSAEAPLIVSATRGRGRVTVLLFAPELEPARSWKNLGHMWAKLIDAPPELFTQDYVNRQGGRPVDGVFGAMVDSKQVRKLPVGWLLVLLLGYLAVIGPLDQYWLKKLNRQMLTWLTFPAYVAFFSLLIYFIGYKLRAGETEWNELHVVDVLPHGERADLRGRSYGSMYSPVNARYEFASEEPFAVWRGEYMGTYGGQDPSRATVEQRPAGFRARASVPVWTSQLFAGDWWRQDDLPVGFSVTQREIVIDNNLDVPLTRVRVVIGERMFDLPEVPAREKKTIARTGLPNTSVETFVSGYTRNFYEAANARQRAFSTHSGANSTISDLAAATAAVSLLDTRGSANNYESIQQAPGIGLRDVSERGGAILLAWLPDHSLTKPLNQFSARRGVRNTLLRVLAEETK